MMMITIDNRRAIDGDYGPASDLDQAIAHERNSAHAGGFAHEFDVTRDATDAVGELRNAYERALEAINRAIYGTGFGDRGNVLSAGVEPYEDRVTVQMASHIARERGELRDLGEDMRAADQAIRTADTAMRAMLNDAIAGLCEAYEARHEPSGAIIDGIER